MSEVDVTSICHSDGALPLAPSVSEGARLRSLGDGPGGHPERAGGRESEGPLQGRATEPTSRQSKGRHRFSSCAAEITHGEAPRFPARPPARGDEAGSFQSAPQSLRPRAVLATILLLCLAPLAMASEKPQPSPLEFLEAMSRAGLKNSGAEQHAVDGPDGKLVYWSAGEGPVVVLVHGTNDQAGLWWRTVAALKGHYRVVAIDMPGHGESAPAEGPLDMKMMQDGVATIVETVSPDEPVVLIGNSMGGWASLLYALDSPARVRQLVLESSGGISLDTPPSVTLVPTTIEEARAAFDAAIGPDGLIPDPVLEDFVRRAPTSPAARFAERSWEEFLLDDRLARARGAHRIDLGRAGRSSSVGLRRADAVNDRRRHPHRHPRLRSHPPQRMRRRVHRGAEPSAGSRMMGPLSPPATSFGPASPFGEREKDSRTPSSFIVHRSAFLP